MLQGKSPQRGTPSSARDALIQASTGAMHHMSFLDVHKVQLRDCGAATLLMRAMAQRNSQTYENCVGEGVRG